MKIDKRIEVELNRTGLPWEAARGTRHIKLRLAGRFVGILPQRGHSGSARDSRANANVIGQIRRVAREMA